MLDEGREVKASPYPLFDQKHTTPTQGIFIRVLGVYPSTAVR